MQRITFLGLSAPIWIGLIFSLRVGLQALRYKPEHKSTQASLRWIALTLCEPFINFMLIGWMTHISLQQSGVNRYSDDALLHTLPMIVLLLPVKDFLAENQVQRRIVVEVLGLGIARWLTTMAIHFSMSHNHESIGAACVFLVLGTFLLWDSALWGRIQIKQMMNVESYVVQGTRVQA